MSGPHRAYLDHGLAQGRVPQITAASVDWVTNSGRLTIVATALRKAAESGNLLGGQTGPAMFEAMMESSKRLDFHAAQMQKGYGALIDARTMLDDARDARDKIDQDLPPHQTQPYKPDPDLSDSDNQVAKTMYDNNQSSLSATREEQREERARKVVENFDASYRHPIKVMQQIYGYEEPLPGSTPAVDNGIGTHHPPGTSLPPHPPRPPEPPRPPRPPEPPRPPRPPEPPEPPEPPPPPPPPTASPPPPPYPPEPPYPPTAALSAGPAAPRTRVRPAHRCRLPTRARRCHPPPTEVAPSPRAEAASPELSAACSAAWPVLRASAVSSAAS